MTYFSDYMVNVTCGESDVWIDEPTVKGTILYSIVTPCICLFGICGNIISLIVLSNKELKSSIYTYLRLLAATDLTSSVLLFISGLSRGVLWKYTGWPAYDALLVLPLGGVVSCLSVMATVAVAIDRVIYLWDPISLSKPKLCRPKTARRIIYCSVIVSIVFNIPYCFIYKWNDDGTLSTTHFFESKFYMVHNWLKFSLFCVLPALLLIVSNSYLLVAIKRALELQNKSRARCGFKKKRKVRDQIYLTITLVSIVFFFLIGEVPSHIISRKTAVTILFHGNEMEANKSKILEAARQLCTVLNAVDIAINFVLYCLLCPAFRRAMKKTFSRKPSIVTNNLQVNVFVMERGESPEKITKNIIKSLNIEEKKRHLETTSSENRRAFGSESNLDRILSKKKQARLTGKETNVVTEWQPYSNTIVSLRR